MSTLQAGCIATEVRVALAASVEGQCVVTSELCLVLVRQLSTVVGQCTVTGIRGALRDSAWMRVHGKRCGADSPEAFARSLRTWCGTLSGQQQGTGQDCYHTGPCLLGETLRACLGKAAALGLARFYVYLNSRFARQREL